MTTNEEIIVELTRQNIELKAEKQAAVKSFMDVVNARDQLQEAIDRIGKAIQYDGHPMNLASIIESKADKLV